MLSIICGIQFGRLLGCISCTYIHEDSLARSKVKCYHQTIAKVIAGLRKDAFFERFHLFYSIPFLTVSRSPISFAFCISVIHLFWPSILIPEASAGVIPFKAKWGLR